MADDVFGIVGSVQAGAFAVEAVVAEGGFAVVYRAHHHAFRAPVALKCLKVPGSLAGAAQTEFLERFREEAELLFRLSASIPEIVRPLHVGTLESPKVAFVPFIALEWLEGHTLDHMLVQRRADGLGPLKPKRAVRMLAPVAYALHRAHHFPGAQGEIAILHRDLKPENVFLAQIGGQEVPKIVDFGIGKVKSAATQIVGRQSSADTGLSAFTPAYGAPEQWLPKRYGQTGAWTDVWGLALMLVEVMVGRPPLEGEIPALMAQAVDEQRRPTPRAQGIELAPEADAVLARALAVDPQNRYHEVAEFWRDLERALGITPLSEAALAAERGPRTAAGRVVESLDTERPPPDFEAGVAATEPGKTVGIPSARPLARSIPDLVLAPPPASGPAHSAPRSSPGAPPVDSSPMEAQPSQRQVSGTYAAVSRSGSGMHPRVSPAQPSEALFGGKLLDDLDDPVSAAGPRLDVERHVVPVSRARQGATVSYLAAPGESRGGSSMAARLRGPMVALVCGIGVMAADYAYAAFAGEPFALGPVRPFWIAGPLVVAGIALAVLRMLPDD